MHEEEAEYGARGTHKALVPDSDSLMQSLPSSIDRVAIGFEQFHSKWLRGTKSSRRQLHRMQK